jgi:hypothetical protein
MASVDVKKFTHTLYFGKGRKLAQKDGEHHQTIRIRFPEMDDFWNIINEFKKNGGEELLYFPKNKRGQNTFKPQKVENIDDSVFPVKFQGIPDYRMMGDVYVMVKFIFSSEDMAELFWTILMKDENSGVKFIPSEKTKSFWLPEKSMKPTSNLKWISTEDVIPKYPIFVISKGRYERRLTADALHDMKCPFYLVIEDCEKELYKSTEKYETNYLIMPPEMDNLGKGSIPVRNFIWDKAFSDNGPNSRHWCLDDNMDGFYRFYKNQRVKCESPVCFRQCEIMTDMYDNVYISGLQYKSFVPEISQDKKNIILNTRVYSCILLKNNLHTELNTERWRGRYNEDTDICLRVLKSGGANMLFQNFLADKQTTMSCKGGNTSSIYQNDGLQKKLDSLIAQHPDCVKQSNKYGKENHHQVNYKPWFHNPLSRNTTNNELVLSGPQNPEDINEMGLKLIVDETKPIPKCKSVKPKVLKNVEEVVDDICEDSDVDTEIDEEVLENLLSSNESDEVDIPVLEDEKDVIIKDLEDKVRILEDMLVLYINGCRK